MVRDRGTESTPPNSARYDEWVEVRYRSFRLKFYGLLVFLLVLGTAIAILLYNESRDATNAEPGDCIGGITIGTDGSVTSDLDDAFLVDCNDPDALYKVFGEDNTTSAEDRVSAPSSGPCERGSELSLAVDVNSRTHAILCLEAMYLRAPDVAGLPGILSQAIFEDDPGVCDYFTEQGATQFAATVDVGSCAEAITTLADQVTESPSYQDSSGEGATSAVEKVNACSLMWQRVGHGRVTDGPQVGHLTLIRLDSGSFYRIDGVRPC